MSDIRNYVPSDVIGTTMTPPGLLNAAFDIPQMTHGNEGLDPVSALNFFLRASSSAAAASTWLNPTL